MNEQIVSKLKSVVGESNVLTSKVDLVSYSYDATADLEKVMPDIVVLPNSTEEVQKIVNIANENNIAIYPRGSGTNLSGGTIPIKKGIVLSFQKMNKILEIDAENFI